MERHTAGSVTQMVKLHPVAYESGPRRDAHRRRRQHATSTSPAGIVITNLGHAHPRVAEAIGRAARELDNVHDFATPHKVRALEALDAVTPPGMTLFTFFSSGTEAIEGRDARGPGRSPAASASSASTTTTTAARAARPASPQSRASNAPRDAVQLLVPERPRLPVHVLPGRRTCDLRCAGFVGQSVAQNLPGQLAGVVIELVTNGNGATDVPRRATSDEVARTSARRRRRLLIADEIATGFGRTGAWFASTDHEGIVPDVMAHRQGHGQRLPCHRDRRQGRAGRGARRVVPEHQLRRQPDGLRRGGRGGRR